MWVLELSTYIHIYKHLPTYLHAYMHTYIYICIYMLIAETMVASAGYNERREVRIAIASPAEIQRARPHSCRSSRTRSPICDIPGLPISANPRTPSLSKKGSMCVWNSWVRRTGHPIF